MNGRFKKASTGIRYYWGITANGKDMVVSKNIATRNPLIFADMHRE